MSKTGCVTVMTLLGLMLLPAIAAARISTNRQPDVTISFTPSLPSPQKLGTSIVWTATVQNPIQGHIYDYQFSAALQGQTQIVRDFNLPNTFTWTPYQVEGTYVVTTVVRDITQQPYTVFPPVSVQYVLQPWVSQRGGSYVNPTANALIALFSGPPCTTGHFLRVRFRNPLGVASSTTNPIPCSQSSANWYVAGMTPSTLYLMHWEEYGPNFTTVMGTDQPFTTGPLPSNFPTLQFSVKVPATGHDALYPVLLFHIEPLAPPSSFWPVATDLAGNIIWYYPGQAMITRMETGGNFYTISNTTMAGYDLAGNEILETNYNILNEQLAAKGYPTLNSFNAHEVRVLPNGNILLLGSRDEVSYTEQGGTQQNPVDIIGDMILILDHSMQLVWAWDSFTHEDLGHVATLGDFCQQGQTGCPFFNHNFQQANDWLHTNSAQLAPDGNIVISQRSQDWILKIKYQNGHGDGSVIWKMGPYGDFTLLNPPGNPCGDPNVFPWFTHQHDAAIQSPNGSIVPVLTVFDDGNLRNFQCHGGNSRGMVFNVNESARTVYLDTLADMGNYAYALGSAQLLTTPSTTYANFGIGLLDLNGSHTAQAIETDANGRIVYQMQEVNDYAYRIYRQQDLYTPTLP